MEKQSLTAVVVFAISAAALVGGAHATGEGSPRAPTRFDMLRAFDASLQEIPESVTTDGEGNVYVSVGNTVRRRTADGHVEVFGTLPLPIFALGVKVGADGCVYTASSSLSEVEGAFVWRICEPGAVEQFAALDPLGGPNDLAFDDEGNLYVTDPVLGQVWQVDSEGAPSVWLQHPLLAGSPAAPALVFRPLGVNGIAFDRRKRFVYLSNTDHGQIIRARVRPSRADTTSVFASHPLLRGADGIAFDDRGILMVAVNASDALVALDRRGRLSVLAQGGPLDAPSSLVFGVTAADRRRLYLTSSAFSRILGLQSGSPQPALLAGGMVREGLRLP
jgi:sugar lactone lactonase YvrE